MKHYFLSKTYSFLEILEFLFATGRPADLEALKTQLAFRYQSLKNQVQLYHNGRSALAAGLKAALPKNSKVLTTGFTCRAVIEAILAADCIPVYADIDPSLLHFGLKELKESFKKHPDLKAIIIQNTLGNPVPISQIESFAKRHQLLIIEDLAHSAGIIYPDGRLAGTVAPVVALSFGKGKAIDSVSGGALILRDPKLKTKIPNSLPKFTDRLRDRFYPLFSTLARQASYLKLDRLIFGTLIKLHFIQRSADAKLNINITLPSWQAKLTLKSLAKLPSPQPPLRSFFLVREREQVLNKLRQAGYYFSEIWYDVPISPSRTFSKFNFPFSDCPNAKIVSEQIINFPIHYSKKQLQAAHKIIKPYLVS